MTRHLIAPTPLMCDDLKHFFVIYDSKLVIFGFWSAGPNMSHWAPQEKVMERIISRLIYNENDR